MEQELGTEAPDYRYDDAQIVRMLQDDVTSSSGDVASLMETQRADAYAAYYGVFPNPLDGVSSEHRSRDVLDAVEGIKAKMLRTFSSTRNPVYFDAEADGDAEAAELATDYVKAVFYRENPGYRNLSWAFHDALLTKVCIFKRWHEVKTERIPETFTDVPYEQLTQVASREDVEIAELTDDKIITEIIPTPYGPTPRQRRVVSGVLYRVEQRPMIRVDVIPPEDFGFEANARSLDEARSCWERHDYSRGELIAYGFDPIVVDKLQGGDAVNRDTQRASRFSVDDSINRIGRKEGESRLITTYEHYRMVDMDDDGEPEMWQFIRAGSTLLHKERVAEKPYRSWSPFLLSHKGIGMSIADVTTDIQRTNSNIIRGAIDTIFRANNPTKIANLSGGVIKNPQDLINNPPGLVIDSSDPNAVSVPPQPQVNTATFSVYEMVKQEKEQRTGLSRLSQGLNGDAISNQNSEDMIANLTNASNERVLEMARSFAEIVLKPLFDDIYRIGFESGHVIEMAKKGKVRMLGPQQMGYRAGMTVAVALTDEEIARRAGSLIAIHNLMSLDEAVKPLYGPVERYGVYAALFDLAGYSAPFLANPNDPQVKQRLGMQAQQAMAQEAEAKAKAEAVTLAQIQIQKQQVDGTLQLGKEKLDLDAEKAADDVRFKNANLTLDWAKAEAEFRLERDQNRPVAITE
jgi:hypothetical protein